MTGLRPIVELMYIDFFAMAMDQIANQAAKMRYMFGGQIGVPMIIRTQGGIGRSAGAQHSQSLESWIMHLPGLYLCAPSTPNDAYHLLKKAINRSDPTIFIEHKMLYNTKGKLDKMNSAGDLNKASVRLLGKDITIISYSRMISLVNEAASILKNSNISVEIIDLRSLKPFDKETIIDLLSIGLEVFLTIPFSRRIRIKRVSVLLSIPNFFDKDVISIPSIGIEEINIIWGRVKFRCFNCVLNKH